MLQPNQTALRTKLIDMATIQHPVEPEVYGIVITFECENCEHHYSFEYFDQQQLEAFMTSLQAENPNRDISCHKCNKNIN